MKFIHTVNVIFALLPCQIISKLVSLQYLGYTNIFLKRKLQNKKKYIVVKKSTIKKYKYIAYY